MNALYDSQELIRIHIQHTVYIPGTMILRANARCVGGECIEFYVRRLKRRCRSCV